jgi:hypothetical protein
MADNNNSSSSGQEGEGGVARIEVSSSNKGDNDNYYFSFKYTESGGLTARYLLISFDSNTNTLTSSTDISGSNLSQKTISDSDKQELKETIIQNNFFESKADYPPENPSLVGYSLAITISDKTHTTAWTNTSKEMPDSIKKVIDEIKKVVTKEKVV